MKTEHDNYLLLSAQRALIGEVPPRLRSVSFDLSFDGEDLIARFEFDGEPVEDELECARVVMTNIVADYPKNHRSYREDFVCNPSPRKPKFLRLIAFYRNEDVWTTWGKAFNIRLVQRFKKDRLSNLHSAALKHDFLNYVESKLRGSKTGILKIHH